MLILYKLDLVCKIKYIVDLESKKKMYWITGQICPHFIKIEKENWLFYLCWVSEIDIKFLLEA